MLKCPMEALSCWNTQWRHYPVEISIIIIQSYQKTMINFFRKFLVHYNSHMILWKISTCFHITAKYVHTTKESYFLLEKIRSLSLPIMAAPLQAIEIVLSVPDFQDIWYRDYDSFRILCFTAILFLTFLFKCFSFPELLIVTDIWCWNRVSVLNLTLFSCLIVGLFMWNVFTIYFYSILQWVFEVIQVTISHIVVCRD